MNSPSDQCPYCGAGPVILLEGLSLYARYTCGARRYGSECVPCELYREHDASTEPTHQPHPTD